MDENGMQNTEQDMDEVDPDQDDHPREADPDLWNCAACADQFRTPHAEPLYTDEYRSLYCVECIEHRFQAIADENEEEGLPRINDTVLADLPDVMAGIDPGLRARFETGLARLREAAPDYRVYCSWPAATGDGKCNAYLGRRVEVNEDKSHQWTTCSSYQHTLCMACESRQSEQNKGRKDCAVPQWFVDWYKPHYGDERGTFLQYCPHCDRLITLLEACNEMRCICGQHFCLICGNGFPSIYALRGHYKRPEPDWCPQYKFPNDLTAIHPSPWTDARKAGGWHFPALLLGDSSSSRDAKQVAYLDREMRQYRRLQPPGDASETESLRHMLLSGRHLFILSHNRKESQDESGRANIDNLYERFCFAHFAHQFRYHLQRLSSWDHYAELLPKQTPISDEPIDWYARFALSRRLRFRKNAVSEHWSRREADYRVIEAAISEAWRYGGYDEDLPSADSVAEPEKPRARARLRTKQVLRCIRECLHLLLSNRRTHFSASYSYFLMRKSNSLRQEMLAISEEGVEGFYNSGPDSKLGWDVGWFLTERLLQEEIDELDLLDPDKEVAEDQADRIWPREIALVYLEAREAMAPDLLPLEYGELGDAVRRLQIAIHDEGHTAIARETVEELWDQYTSISSSDARLPSPGNSALKPLFFKMILILRTTRDLWYQDDEPLEGSPDFDDGPPQPPQNMVHGRGESDWEDDWRWIRNTQDELFGRGILVLPEHEEDPQLELLENVDSALARIWGLLHFVEWERDADIEMLHKLEDIQGGWQQGRGVLELPRFQPAERQQRMERILGEVVRVMRELFGIYERPVELDQDFMRHGRMLGVWHHDRIWLDELREDLVYRRALLEGEDEDVLHDLRQLLAIAALLVHKIRANEWLLAESLLSRRRLQMLEQSQTFWAYGDPAFPQFAAHDQQRMDEILERLVAALRERYPRDDQIAEDNAERLRDASDSEEQEDSDDPNGHDSGEEALEAQDEAR